ncbi:MAG: hypothetical protein ACREFD_15715 [Stellaceae bacterium]
MKRAVLILISLLALGACTAAPAASVPYYRIPPGPAEPSSTTSRRTPIPGAAILGPAIAPPASSEYGRAPATVPSVPAMPAAAPSNPGPVTGYGIGGMEQPPGAPPNPPYTGRGFGPGD